MSRVYCTEDLDQFTTVNEVGDADRGTTIEADRGTLSRLTMVRLELDCELE